MLVKILNGKIVEINTSESNIEIPPEMMGTDFRAWTYNNGQWTKDPNYQPPPDHRWPNPFKKIT